MLEAVQCTCGKNIGSLIDLYDFLWEKIKSDYKQKYAPDVEIDRTQWDQQWDVTCGALMDALHFDQECCRMNMLSKIKISKMF